MRLLHSRLLADAGIRHGFSTREAGTPDVTEHVVEVRRRLAEWLGLPQGVLFELEQVHGRVAYRLREQDTPSAVAVMQGDALVTMRAGTVVGVRTADCLPLLLAHPSSGTVAAVHAGWRGAVAGVVHSALETMAVPPADVLAAIGPHIRACHFEIGDEVARAMQLAAPGAVVIRRHADQPKPHGDLAALVRWQLGEAGVARIDDVAGCTFCDAERFFSHRRDRGRTGRHLALIAGPSSVL